jgi:hypothetical protein
MRETNVWMIRKCRYLLWFGCAFVPLYRNFYWDYIGRRVVLKEWLSGWTEDQKREDAIEKRSNWGYKPRYEPIYDFSLKKSKYDEQSLEEYYEDHPRITTSMGKERIAGKSTPREIWFLTSIAQEHNRQPGSFNYNFPQTFYSLYPEIEQETYITIGGKSKRRVHEDMQE